MRPPKSTAQHVADGTYEPSRHDGRGDVTLAIGVPDAPSRLTGRGLELWEIVTGTLPEDAQSRLDTATLEGACWWWGRFCDVRERIDAGGCDEYKGMIMAATYWKQFALMAAKFGMSPADRCKLKLSAGENKESPLEMLLKRRSRN